MRIRDSFAKSPKLREESLLSVLTKRVKKILYEVEGKFSMIVKEEEEKFSIE